MSGESVGIGVEVNSGPVFPSGGGARSQPPASNVMSLNGRTGDVTLTKADITGTGLTPADIGAPPSSAYVAVNEAPLNPLAYGAVGDAATVDDAAFASMVAALPAVGGDIYLPPRYCFRLSQPITLANGMHLRGSGAGQVSVLNTASDLLTVPATGNLYNVHIHDVGMRSGAGGGHVLNATAGAIVACSQLDHLYLQQDNPGKSAILTSGWLDNTVEESFFYGAPNRSVPLIKGLSTTDNLSDNRFRDLRLTDQGKPTTWAMWWEEASSTNAFGNVFEEITFENPVGGAITVRGQWGYRLSGLYLWDLSAASANDLVAPRRSVGYQPNYGGLIERVAFPSGLNGAGLYTIGFGGIGEEFYTLVRRCGPATGSATLSINTNRNIAVRVEDCGAATVANYTPNMTVQAGAGTGATTSVAVAGLYANTLTVTTGTSPAAGMLASVWSNSNGWMEHPPVAVETFPMNAAAAAAAPFYPSACSTAGVPQGGALTGGGFVINCANAPAASTPLLIGYRIHPDLRG